MLEEINFSKIALLLIKACDHCLKFNEISMIVFKC